MDVREYLLAVFFFGGLSMMAMSLFAHRRLDEQRFVKPPDRDSFISMAIIFWDGLGMAAAGAVLWVLGWELDWPFFILALAVTAATTIYGIRSAFAKYPPNDR